MIRLASNRGRSVEHRECAEIRQEILAMERFLEEGDVDDYVWIGDNLRALGCRLKQLWDNAQAAGIVSIDEYRP